MRLGLGLGLGSRRGGGEGGGGESGTERQVAVPTSFGMIFINLKDQRQAMLPGAYVNGV